MSDLSQIIVITLAIGGIFLYFPVNRIKAPGRWFFQDTRLDAYIPLVPYFVIPYIALYPYIIVTMIAMLFTSYAEMYYTCMAIAAWSAALFWYFFPAGMLRRREIGPGLLSHMIVWLHQNDHENNTIPSSHVFYALICSYFFALAFPSYMILFAAVGLLISASTVLVKQHHIADILGGILWTVASIVLAQYLVV